MGQHRAAPTRSPRTVPRIALPALVLTGGLVFAGLQWGAAGGDVPVDPAADLYGTGRVTAPVSSDDDTYVAPPTQLGQVLVRESASRAAPEVRGGTSDQVEVTETGPLGEITVPESETVTGTITTSVANIPNTSLNSAWYSSINTLIGPEPDFVTLNEVFMHDTSELTASAPGYTAFKIDEPDTSPGAAGQSLNNALLYRSDTWTMLDGGRIRVVNDDRGRLRGKAFLWDRFATWAILQRDDGAIVSLISVHMPTNPNRTPTVPGFPASARAALYGSGMDTLVAVVDQLSAYGPVLVGGDMNSHPTEGAWTAASKMGAAGYEYAKDQGVMYLFFDNDAALVDSQQVAIHSDHPAIITTVDLSALGQ